MMTSSKYPDINLSADGGELKGAEEEEVEWVF